jgi:hypothetical protein
MNDVALFFEDPMHPVDGRLCVARRLHREDVVVLVLEVAGLMRPQTGERVRDRRRLQTDGRDGVEVHGVGHDSLPNTPNRLRRPKATSAVKPDTSRAPRPTLHRQDHDVPTFERGSSGRHHRDFGDPSGVLDR